MPSRGSVLLPRLGSFALVAVAIAINLLLAKPGWAETFLRAEDGRVARIGYRIGVRAAHLCPQRTPQTGLHLQHLAEYAPEDRARVIAARALDRGPGIVGVAEDSPAEKAGFRAGDVLLAVNSKLLAPPVPVPSADEARSRSRMLLEEALSSDRVQIRIQRDSAEQTLSLFAVQGCPARVRLARSAQPIAVADRGEVVVTTALLGEVRNDDELAVVIAHEIAHVVLGHAELLRAAGVPDGPLREFGRNAARVRATEEEADRLGLRLAAAAGYDPAAALTFWRRYYARYDGPRLFRTHPSLPARERLIRQVLAELETGAQRPELGKSALGQR